MIDEVALKKIRITTDGNVLFISDYLVYEKSKDSLRYYEKRSGLKDFYIYDVLPDRENNLWFCMAGGVGKLVERSIVKLSPENLDGYVTGFIKDIEGRIWFKMNEDVYYLHNNKCVRVKLSGIDKVIAVGQNNKEELLLVSKKRVSLVDSKSLDVIKTRSFNTEFVSVENIFYSLDGQVFMFTGDDKKLYYLENINSKLKIFESNLLKGIFQLTEYNNEIIGGSSNGLIRFNGKEFERFLKTAYPIWGVEEIKDTLYVFSGKGLALYEDSVLKYIETNNVKNDVNSVVIDNENNYWIGQNNGVIFLSGKEFKERESKNADHNNRYSG